MYGRDPYVAPNDYPTPRYSIFCLTIGHGHGTSASRRRLFLGRYAVLASGAGGGSERVPGGVGISGEDESPSFSAGPPTRSGVSGRSFSLVPRDALLDRTD